MRSWGVALICTGCLAQPTPPPGSTGGPVVYRQVFAQSHAELATTSFVATPMAADGEVVVLLGCTTTGGATATFEITAPGWTFEPLAAAMQADNQAAQAFGATIRIGETATFSVATTGCSDITAIGDEFGGTAASAVDGVALATGSGACDVATTTRRSGDAVWAACLSAGSALAADPFMQAANDEAGNVSEYRLTNDPAGTFEHSAFQNGVSYVAALVALSPR